MSYPESFRAKKEALALRLRDEKKLTYQQIASRLGLSKSRIGQIYHAARRKILFPPNGLSKRMNRLLTLCGFTVDKSAIRGILTVL